MKHLRLNIVSKEFTNDVEGDTKLLKVKIKDGIRNHT